MTKKKVEKTGNYLSIKSVLIVLVVSAIVAGILLMTFDRPDDMHLLFTSNNNILSEVSRQ